MTTNSTIKTTLLIAGVCSATLASAQHNICMQDDTLYNTAKGIRDVIAKDFNKDGKIDIAAAIYNDKKMCLHLGNGDGTFATAIDYTLSDEAAGITSADFNNDGNLDIALHMPTELSKVAVMLGSSTGNFSTPVYYNAGDNSSGIATGDFNNDNVADIAVSNTNSNNVSVFTGNGDGTFIAATNYTIGTTTYTTGIAVADLNGDGIDDIATSNFKTNDASVFISTGTSFATPVHYTVSHNNSPMSVALNDFNGDGKMDMCVALMNSDSVAVLTGAGNGTFGNLAKYAVGGGSMPLHMVTADMNADGIPDIITTNFVTGNPGTVTILAGLGNNTFSVPYTFPSGPYAIAANTADLNNDGYNDIVVSNDAGTGAYTIILNALPNLATTVNNTTITAEQAGVSYQWIDCATKINIPGATQKSFTPTASGNYAVIIDNGICTATSGCKTVTVPTTSVHNVDIAAINVFPNPADDILFVELGHNAKASYVIQDITGKTIMHNSLYESKSSLNISTLEPGLYMILLKKEDIQKHYKFIKQ